MRNPELMFDIIVTDEDNALQKTGENATTEEAEKSVYSNIQAGRYVHNIYICPEGEMDENVDIKLMIRNREKGIAHCYLYYKLDAQWIPLGYVDIDVKFLIENWIKVEPRFFQYLKNRKEEDKKYLDLWSKRDFYILYMIKKYEKMELMNREKILRPRELDYSEVILSVVNKLKNLVTIMSLNELRMPIQTKVESEFKKRGIPFSMVGIEMASRRVLSFLTILKSIETVKTKINQTLIKFQKGKIDEETYNETIKILVSQRDELKDLSNNQFEEIERYAKINKKYNTENGFLSDM